MIITLDTTNKTIILSEETDFLEILKLIDNLKSLYGEEEDWKISKTVITKETSPIVKDFMKDILTHKSEKNPYTNTNPNPLKVMYSVVNTTDCNIPNCFICKNKK